jgi:hypothetical protein
MTTRSRCVALVLACVTGVLVGAAAPPRAVASGRIPPEMRWCLTEQWGPPRPIPDLRHQKKVAHRALRTRDPDYVVKRAEPSHFGTIALVDGNLAKASRELRGVDRVVSWTKHFLSDFPPGMRLDVYKTDLLMPLMQEIDHATDGSAGKGDFAFWQDGDAVVLPWKAPVPAEVQALAGVRPDGAELRVVPVPYSTEELLAAQDRLIDLLDARHVRWSTVSHCDSNAGVELEVPTKPGRLAVSQAELDQAAGVRVLVLEGYVYAD